MLDAGSRKRSWTKTTNVWILQLFVSMDQIISMCFICIVIQAMIGIWSFSSVKQTCDDKWWHLCVFKTTPCCHTCLGFPTPHLHRNLRITFLCVRSNSIYFLQQHLLFATELSPCPQKVDFRVQPFSAVFCFCFDQLLIMLRHFSFISSPRSYYGHSVLV